MFNYDSAYWLQPKYREWQEGIIADKKRIQKEAGDLSRAIVASDILRDASIGAATGAGLGWLVGNLPGAGVGALVGAFLGWVKNLGSHGRMMNGLFEEPYDNGMYLRRGSKAFTDRYGSEPI